MSANLEAFSLDTQPAINCRTKFFREDFHTVGYKEIKRIQNSILYTISSNNHDLRTLLFINEAILMTCGTKSTEAPNELHNAEVTEDDDDGF